MSCDLEVARAFGEMTAVEPFLDAVAAAVEQQDQRAAVLEAMRGDALHLVLADAAVGAAEHREVESAQGDGPAVDARVAGQHAVGRRLEVLRVEGVALGLDERADLVEAAVVDERGDAFACRQLAQSMLPLDGGGAGS